MRGEAGWPLEVNCGRRNAGWLGSFQIEYSTLDAVVAADGGHELFEVLIVGARDVGRGLVGRRPARHGRGDGQQHLPVQALRFVDQRVVFAPAVARRVGRVEGGLGGGLLPGRDVVPGELDAQRFDAEGLQLGDRVRARGRGEQVGGALEVDGLAVGGEGRGGGERSRRRRGGRRRAELGGEELVSEHGGLDTFAVVRLRSPLRFRGQRWGSCPRCPRSDRSRMGQYGVRRALPPKRRVALRACPSQRPRTTSSRTHAQASANARPPLLVIEPLRAFLDEHGIGAGRDRGAPDRRGALERDLPDRARRAPRSCCAARRARRCRRARTTSCARRACCARSRTPPRACRRCWPCARTRA